MTTTIRHAPIPTAPRAVPPAPAVPLSVWLIRVLWSSLCVGLIGLSLALAASAAFALNYRGHIYPGVRAWGVDLSGMTASEAALALSAAYDYPSAPVFTLRAGDRTWNATPAQLGLTFDLPATVNAAYSVGRTGNPVVDAWQQFQAWYAGLQTSPIVHYDDRQMLFYLNNVAQEVFEPTVEASLQVDGTTVTVTPGQIGRQLDVVATAALLRPQVLALGRADVVLTFIETPPLVLDASAQAQAAQNILAQPLQLTIAEPLAGDPGPWELPPSDLAKMLEVRRVQDTPATARYEVGLNASALRAYLQPLAEPLQQTMQNARFIFNDETRQLDLIGAARPERQLDIEASITAINAGLLQGQHQIPLTFQITPPTVGDTATAEQLGITELVHAETTYFSGSSAERVTNIQVAAARFHGLLVPPNSTFSFGEYLGDVSLDSGYAEALIIYGGRTIRGVGGGVCQVSTTLFRTAYFGGFPIVERYSHAYRVGYYERGTPGGWSGPGLDATVYTPLVDFKFQNDTPYWLLMETYVTPSNGRIQWKFYSTSDGRETVVSLPVVENRVPAPEPLYEEDPALAPGEIKQVDFAAEGADVIVRRVITRNGEQINANEPPMQTHYQPWRAVYHYGPGTQGIPTPVPTPMP